MILTDAAGDGGESTSGEAIGGNSDGTTTGGGSATSGDSGDADGGDIINEATGEGTIENDGTSTYFSGYADAF